MAQGWLSVYMDDITIHTKAKQGETEEQHQKQYETLTHLVLDILEENDLYLKPEKCEFLKKEIDYLGVIIRNNQIKMDPTKLKGVANWTTPQNPTDIRKFLGFTGYYRYFVPNYSKIARSLLDLTKKATPWLWEPKHKRAFEELKTRMCAAPVLSQPNFKKKFFLQVDASGFGVGAVPLQEGEHSTPLLLK